MKEEISALRTSLQDLIARAERDYGSDNEFVSALRSADDNLADAEDEFDNLTEEEESTEE